MIYSLLMISMILVFVLETGKNKNEKKRKRYCFIIGILLFLVAAIRGISVGSDVGQYRRIFELCKQLSWGDLFSRYINEPGFYILCKSVGLITNDFQILLAIVGAIYAVAISVFIFKNSYNCMISFLMLIPFQFYSFSLSGLRQTVALSVVLAGFSYVKQRKLVKYLISILIAFVFHNTAILGVFIFFLYQVNPTKRVRVFFFFMVLVFFWFKRQIIEFGLSLSEKYTYLGVSSSGVGTAATLILYVAILALYVMFGENKNIPAGEKSYETIMMAGILFQILVPYQPTIFRLAMYFQMFNVLAVPVIVSSKSLTIESRRIAISLFILLMFVMYYGFTYYSADVNPYMFFWQ